MLQNVFFIFCLLRAFPKGGADIKDLKADLPKKAGYKPDEDVHIVDVKSNISVFLKKYKKLIISAGALLLLILSINVCVELNYALILSDAENTVPEYIPDKYYYNIISYREQVLYNSIFAAADICAEYSDILPYKFTAAEFGRIVKYLLADHPECFYLTASSAEMLSNGHKTRVKLTYYHTPAEIEAMKTELDMAVDVAAMSVDENSDEFTREAELHDYLIRNCTFAEADNNENGLYNTAYGALVAGKAYSDGYALALKLLYDRNGIQSLVVYGTTGNQPHAWNLISLGRNYYHVDASWNDADLYFEPDLMFHGYFNLSDAVILLDHRPEDKSKLPAASDEHSYYHEKELYADSVVALERIIYRELLKAGYAQRNYLEIFIHLPGDKDDYYDIIIEVIKRINNVQDDFKLMPVYREYNASFVSDAATIRLYYEN